VGVKRSAFQHDAAHPLPKQKSLADKKLLSSTITLFVGQYTPQTGNESIILFAAIFKPS
jgi:hypothetical protein